MTTKNKLVQEEIKIEDSIWYSEFYKTELGNKTEHEVDILLEELGYKVKIYNLVDIYKDNMLKSIQDKCKETESICLAFLGNKFKMGFFVVKIKPQIKEQQ